MSAVLTPSIHPEYLRSLIQEALKPVLEELRKTQEEMELWKSQCLELMEAKIKDSYETLDFKTAVETVIITSEQKILPRLQEIEKITGQWDFEGDEHPPTIPERIEALEKRPITSAEKPIKDKKDNSPAIPSTSLDFKAFSLMVHLQEVKPNWAGEICLETKEFYNFMIEKIDENLRWKPDLRNKREAKKQIFERALEMFPNILTLKKSKSGKHVTGIALNVGKT